MARHTLDLTQQAAFLAVDQRYSHPDRACPGRPPDAMDVTFRHVWKLVIDDVRDEIDIDPSGRNIGRDKHTDLGSPQ